jgi:hypothetical protein
LIINEIIPHHDSSPFASGVYLKNEQEASYSTTGGRRQRLPGFHLEKDVFKEVAHWDIGHKYKLLIIVQNGRRLCHLFSGSPIARGLYESVAETK